MLGLEYSKFLKCPYFFLKKYGVVDSWYFAVIEDLRELKLSVVWYAYCLALNSSKYVEVSSVHASS